MQKIHSLLGATLILFLFVHLITYFLSGLIFFDQGKAFIALANFWHNIPFSIYRIIFLVFLPLSVQCFAYITYADCETSTSNG